MANDDTATWLDSIFTVSLPQTNWDAGASLYIFAQRGGVNEVVDGPVCWPDGITGCKASHSRKVVGGDATWCDAHPCAGGTPGDVAGGDGATVDSDVSAKAERSREVAAMSS